MKDCGEIPFDKAEITVADMQNWIEQLKRAGINNGTFYMLASERTLRKMNQKLKPGYSVKRPKTK